jgi:glucose-6-phosphate isomerase
MALQQSIEHARPKDFDAVLARTARALAGLRTQHTKGTLPLLRLPEKRDDIATILGYATLLRDGASDVVFLGTGGSSLGGQTLAQLAGYAVPGVRALRPSQQVRAKRGPMTRLRECRNP